MGLLFNFFFSSFNSGVLCAVRFIVISIVTLQERFCGGYVSRWLFLHRLFNARACLALIVVFTTFFYCMRFDLILFYLNFQFVKDLRAKTELKTFYYPVSISLVFGALTLSLLLSRDSNRSNLLIYCGNIRFIYLHSLHMG